MKRFVCLLILFVPFLPVISDEQAAGLTATTVPSKPMASAATTPRGSVVLKSSALLRFGSTQCGKVKGSWISGKITKIKSKNYFVSYVKSSQIYSSDSKRVKGSQKKKLLQLASDYKFRASGGDKKCARYNALMPVTPTAPVATTISPAVQPLKFDIGNAVALTLNDETISTASIKKYGLGSNLQKVDKTGNRSDAVVSGLTTIRRFLIAPNDKLYVEFQDKSLVDGSPCLLAEVERKSGLPRCIESDTDFRFLGVGQDPENWSENRPFSNDIQFDAAGNIFYAGIPGGWQKDYPASPNKGIWIGKDICNRNPCGMASVVRRYANGEIKDIGSAMIGKGGVDRAWCWCSTPNTPLVLRPIKNFHVFSNGNILIDAERDWVYRSGDCQIDGKDCRYDQSWGSDLWSAAGDLISPNVTTNMSAVLMSMDDQRVIRSTGSTGDSNFHMFELITTTERGTPALSPIRGTEGNGFIDESICGLNSATDFHWYGCRGNPVRYFWRTPSGEVFVVAGQDPFSHIESYNRVATKEIYDEWIKRGAKYGSGVLLQIYPTVRSTRVGLPQDPHDLQRIETYASSLNEFYASGLNANGERETIVYNTSSNKSTVLVPSSAGIRVTKMAFSAKSNSLLFVGVQGSTGLPIFGLVDRLTNKLVVIGNSKSVSDLQAFSS